MKKKEKEIIKFIDKNLMEICDVEYKTRTFGILKKYFIEIEGEILVQRLESISNVNEEFFLICNDCHIKQSIFYCEKCAEGLCNDCYNKCHTVNFNFFFLINLILIGGIN